MLGKGLRAAFAGLKVAFREPTVARSYWRLVFILFAMIAALDVGGLWSLFHFTDWGPDAQWYAIVGLVLLRIVGTVMLLILAPIVSILVVNIVVPFFGQGPFMAGLRAIDPELAATLESRPSRPVLTSAGLAAIRFVIFIVLSAVALLTGFIPVVGPFVAVALSLVVTARSATWELLDPYFDKMNYGWDEQYKFVRKHQAAIIGFGLPVAVVMAIPVFGPLCFVLAQAAAPKLLVEVLGRSDAHPPPPTVSTSAPAPAS